MPDDENALVLKLLMDVAVARKRAAEATLNAYAANALPELATEEDLRFWRDALNDAEDEILRLTNGDN
ncbi:hypothetical protein GOZ78_10040 [Agrobacterium vitis]|uniref:Uncharacterized protein n=1 Tax=Agrobacterium vitis TaxID=373 RepID=A0A1S2E2J9_AGRVI|nr:hypothetical protein [Agrobacterium vitis]MUO78379.1 hypothetical protein [Agrobacterium vitis]MUO94256.1 hypothetical protein [Agrobacterium vitis]MUP03290.1 hypothetical protein [Agrobacterium vitis]MUZ74361.1 hypothetical protein [Agrobacterium vitis]MUZ84404.1 hypothetical protein [Agrobacterium vitis]